MNHDSENEAWVKIPSEDEMPPGPTGRYRFNFRPAMGRLLSAHDTLGPAFSALYNQIMHEPGHLSRREREVVASVASAAQDCYY